MSTDPKDEYSIRKLRAKLDPSRLAGILESVDHIRDDRQTRWLKVMFRLNKAVRVVLDRHGIVGMYRIFYYDYSKSLWKLLSKYPESVWNKHAQIVFNYYTNLYNLKEDVLKDVTEVTVKTIKEIFEEWGVIEGGGEKTGDNNTG